MATIYTIGHSTRSFDELMAMLRSHGVQALADVRRFAGSRRLPHFNAENLAVELRRQGLQYLPCPDLGGRRKPNPDSTNTGWRNESFRAYADYMQTPQFGEALDRLVAFAAQTPTAMMCAEAVPWRCHRSLIGDALLVRGWMVLDIMSESKATPHKLTPFAKVDGGRITYPGELLLFEHAGDADSDVVGAAASQPLPTTRKQSKKAREPRSQSPDPASSNQR
jgi:uncharacterized protein (DUF488 family)